MAKGKTKRVYLGREGLVVSSDSPDWGFVYEKSLVKDANWDVGDSVVLPDGREYVYSKSAGACISGQGAEFTYTGYTAYTAFGVAAAVDAKEVTVPAATHAALTQDELRNGYIIIFDGSTNNVQFRGIIGNDAAAANAAFKVYLDGPLTEAVTTSSACETYKNPYNALQTGTVVSLAKAGIPAVKITAANTYFWVQRNGFTWVAPQSTITGKHRGACWRHDGSLDSLNSGADAAAGQYANVTTQYAGYAVTGSQDGNGPLFMLQG